MAGLLEDRSFLAFEHSPSATDTLITQESGHEAVVTVVLESIIQKDGSINVNGVSRSLGYGLDDAAKEALKSWKCNPGKLDGKAVAVQIQIVINFHLY